MKIKYENVVVEYTDKTSEIFENITFLNTFKDEDNIDWLLIGHINQSDKKNNLDKITKVNIKLDFVSKYTTH